MVSHGYCQVSSIVLVLEICSNFSLTWYLRRKVLDHSDLGFWWVFTESISVSLWSRPGYHQTMNNHKERM